MRDPQFAKRSRVRETRERLGLSQQELAGKLGLDLAALVRLENGEARLRDLHRLALEALRWPPTPDTPVGELVLLQEEREAKRGQILEAPVFDGRELVLRVIDAELILIGFYLDRAKARGQPSPD